MHRMDANSFAARKGRWGIRFGSFRAKMRQESRRKAPLRESRKPTEKMRSVPKRRAEALPYGALVMEEMIHGFNLKEVVVSAYGLREGVLQRKLSPQEAEKDPLVEFARDLGARESRTPAHGQEL